MIAGSIDAIDRPALYRLLANGVAESRTLEYKRDLPNPKDKDSKREFLADVSSFANAQGGDLLYRIEAPKGVPTAIPGLLVTDPDLELRRWEEILQDGVEPRLAGLRLRWIAFDDGRGVMLIRMPPSPIAPHRITFNNWSRFYNRRSNAKYEMDAQELREAFTASEALPTRLRALHFEAVETARRGDLPIGLGNDPRAIVSVMPVALFRETRDLEITPENALAPVKPSGYMDAIEMIEGVLLHTNRGESGDVRSYAVTYRIGRTDTVWTIGRVVDELKRTENKLVWPARFEEGLLDCAISTAWKLAPFGVEGPWIAFVTLTGIENFKLLVNQEYASEPAWRGEVSLPPLRVKTINRAALLPLLRSFWLAFGIRRPDEPDADR